MSFEVQYAARARQDLRNIYEYIAYDLLVPETAARQAQRKMMEHFMEELKRMLEMVDSFDEGAWYALVDYVTVCGKDDVRFTFKNGAEIRV